MVGYNQFIHFFGDITLSKIVGFILAILFIFGIYKQLKKFLENKKSVLIKKYEDEKEKNKKLDRVLAEVDKYPQYREQSRKIQQEFREEIDGLKKSQEYLADTQQEINLTIKNMQEKQERREKNKLRDKLLSSYRYYTDCQRNPKQEWTEMEAEAFWELFRDYEDMGGDGYMHTVVQPAMNLLRVINNS